MRCCISDIPSGRRCISSSFILEKLDNITIGFLAQVHSWIPYDRIGIIAAGQNIDPRKTMADASRAFVTKTLEMSQLFKNNYLLLFMPERFNATVGWLSLDLGRPVTICFF